MADQEQSQSPETEAHKPGMMDGAMMNQVITLYLYGCYILKNGRMTPPEAMEKVVQLSKMMDKAGSMSKRIQSKIGAFYGRED